jgi:hypothetical protein
LTSPKEISTTSVLIIQDLGWGVTQKLPGGQIVIHQQVKPLMWAPIHNLQQPYLKSSTTANICTITSIDGRGFNKKIMKTQTTNKATTEEKQVVAGTT